MALLLKHQYLKTDAHVLEDVMARLNYELPRKFLVGAKEHGGWLTDRNCVSEAFKEAIDLCTYLQAIEMQQNAIRSIIADSKSGAIKVTEALSLIEQIIL